MKTEEALWREYVEAYDIHVPEERIEKEYDLICADLRHRMTYAQMSGEESHPFPDFELANQKDALRAAALFEAKEPLVLRDLTMKLDISVTADELHAAASAVAEREHTTIDELKRFFGDDFALLKRDVLESKIRAWACERAES